MINREKLISALHCRAQDLTIDPPACDGCDYQTMNYRGCDIRRICKDALDMLKEIEPVQSGVDADGVPRCGSCGWIQSYGCKYCDNCGKRLFWE